MGFAGESPVLPSTPSCDHVSSTYSGTYFQSDVSWPEAKGAPNPGAQSQRPVKVLRT
jgi:hypothetical protein